MTKLKTIYDLSGDKLYEGSYESFCQCVESAVSQGIRLDQANLRYAVLINASLDDAHMDGADFTGANLSGANISCSNLRDTTFCNTDLYNSCLAEARLQNSDFSYARFGGTIISDADISYCRFNSLSAMDLDFTTVCKMQHCQFYLLNHKYSISSPPVIVKGLERPYLIHNILTQNEIHKLIHRNGRETRKLL